MSGLLLNFGPGRNLLPAPWQNLNGAHDIRKPLRFATATVKWILAEHVVEHVSFLQGMGFFSECLRVLEIGGVLRVAFPDVGRFLTSGVPFSENEEERLFGRNALFYAEHMADRARQTGAGSVDPTDFDAPQKKELTRKAILEMLVGWGHQMAWTQASASGALLAVGFGKVMQEQYGEGTISGVDGHHKDVGNAIAKAETTILEAYK